MNPAWRNAGYLPPNWPCQGSGSSEGAVKYDDFADVVPIGEDATLGQTTEKLGEVITKLKGPAAVAVLMLAPLALFADIGPDTQFRDVPPRTTVSEFVDAAGIPAKEVDPTVPEWAKQDDPPAETDPTVPEWAKQGDPPVTTTVTVEPVATEGTNIVSITVNGVKRDVYAPVVTDSRIEEVSERKRKESPYLEVGPEGGVYVVIPE